jgi:peptide/nickel transport system substrate-binding protein
VAPGGTSASSSSTSTSSTSPAGSSTTSPLQSASYDTNATASYALGEQPANWNLHSSTASRWYLTLEQVLAQVWPSAFEVGPSGVAELNSSLLSSATQVSAAPQVVVYQINPRAVWSDGTPITYRDFVYNWEAQSGRNSFKDVGKAPFTPLDRSGYQRISSVRGSPADPYTVTVTFSSPDADWQSLFAYLVPAHIADAVGFDSGFTDPVADLVSGGPYVVSELQAGYSLELVRNPLYWGVPANLATVTYYFMASAAETVGALSAGEIDVATLPAEQSSWVQLQAVNGLSTQVLASARYEDLDFNEDIAPFSDPLVREAVMLAVDRATMLSTVSASYGVPVAPVENRIYLPGEPGYVDDGSNYDTPSTAAALKLLASKGYSLDNGTLRDQRGNAVSLSLAVDPGDPVAQVLAQQVVSSCAEIGIVVNTVQTGWSNDDPLSGGTVPRPPSLPVTWQMAIEVREIPAFASTIGERYATGGPEDLDGYSNPYMNVLLTEASSAVGAARQVLYDQADVRAWDDFTDLPLVQLPVLVVYSSALKNVEVGPYYGGVAWDEEDWGFSAP